MNDQPAGMTALGEGAKPAMVARGLGRRLLPALLAAGVLIPAGLGLNYLLNILLARMLPLEGYGIFSFTLSLTSVLALAASLGFSQSMMRLIPAHRVKGEYAELNGLVRGSFRLVVLSALSVALAVAVFSWFREERALAVGLGWSALMLPLLAVDIWRESSMRGLHKTVDAVLPRQVLLPLLVILLLIALDLNDTVKVFALYLATLALLEAAGLLRLRRALRRVTAAAPVFRFRYWLQVSSPMGLSTLAYHGMRQWDIVLVGVLVGMDASGLYTAAARTALLASLVLRTISLVVGPVLAELYHARQYRRFRRLFGLSMLGSAALGLPLYILVLIYAPQILNIFGEGYGEAAHILRILATGEFINLVTGPVSLALTMSRHERLNMIIVISSAGLGLVALAALVPLYGVTGAAIATASATIVLNLTQCASACWFFAREGRDVPRRAAAGGGA